MTRKLARYFGLFALLWLGLSAPDAAARGFETTPLMSGLALPYYVSSVVRAHNILIVIHGYNHDANRTFDAAVRAAAADGRNTLIVAPIFEMPPNEEEKCGFKGVPGPGRRDAQWLCGGWASGAKAVNGNVTSFQMMDGLIALLVREDKAARVVTVAGFSAGGQFVQRYAGFANPPAGVTMRYVVSDPSSFVYFDPFRPVPVGPSCPHFNDWKFGLGKLPANLGRDGAAARQAYAAADITYMEGALDDSDGPGTAVKLLAEGCAAQAQGSFRLQRGQAYAAYDAKYLAHGAHKLVIVPGCAHAVDCVFPSPAARAVLFQ
jgi:hypothetical protein